MSTYLFLMLVAIAATVPLTGLLLRQARKKTYRELERRVADGEIVAGTAANWLNKADHIQWSGCLMITPTGTLRWEPDAASITRRRAEAREWTDGSPKIEVVGRRRGFTGERYEVLTLTASDTTSATFAVFAEVGPWHQRLGVTPYAAPE